MYVLFPNTRQEILFPSNLVLFTCISAHNQLRRKEKESVSPRTSIGKTKHLGPRPASSTRTRFLFENGIFFSGLAHRQHVSGETHLFKRSPERRFLKTPAFRLRVDGHKQRFSNTMMPYILCFQLEACSVRDAIVFPFTSIVHCFSVFVWTGENDSYTLRVGVYFLKTEKKFSVFKNIKNIQIRVDWA